MANAMDIANSFPTGAQRNRYVAAARTLRAPYLDWAMTPSNGTNAFPAFLVNPEVSLITPNGSQTVSNPLYSYNFHPVDPGLYYSIYLQWPQTLRWPSSTAANAATQNDQLISAMNANQPQYQERLFNLFTQYNDFMDMSTEPFLKSAGPLQQDSIESIHDSVHSTVGGPNYGHMSVIDVSAMDPVFWLHHVYVLLELQSRIQFTDKPYRMIDRTFALWQALYPDSYVQPQQQYQSSYWYNSGDTLDEGTRK